MMLYEHISTKEELELFVKKLNEITHHERYLLFNYTFTTSVYSPYFRMRKTTGDVYDEMWVVKVGTFQIYATTRINRNNDIENPEMRTGMYQNIYFHIDPAIPPGISQPIP